MTLFLFITTLIIFLAIRVPIFVSIAFSSLLALYVGTDVNLTLAIQKFFDGLDKFVLMSLPLFIFAAEIMVIGGVSKRILEWAKSLVNHVTGGLAMTTQVASMFFGALSGSSPATVVAIGKIMYPEMIKENYPRNFSSGLITSSGSIALILPPSITMIVYSSVSNVSVGELFMAGIGAGLLFGIAFIAYIYWFAKKHNLSTSERASLSTLWSQSKQSFWALLVPVIILGGIYSGFFTPTEAAGTAVVYAIFISMVVYKEMDLKLLYQASLNAVVSSAQVMVLISSAALLGWLISVLQVPQMLNDLFLSADLSPWMFLLILNIILLIAGMFIDASTAIIIIAPLFLSTATMMDIDLVHLGVIMVANLAIGMFTPPFGLNLFVSMGITKLKLDELVPGLAKFLIISLIALIIITYIPQITMFIPDLVYVN